MYILRGTTRIESAGQGRYKERQTINNLCPSFFRSDCPLTETTGATYSRFSGDFNSQLWGELQHR